MTTPPATPHAVWVWVDNWKTFHRLTCGLLPNDQVAVALGTVKRSFALEHHVKPCDECHPEKEPS